MSVFIRPYDARTGRFIDEGLGLVATISERHKVEYEISDNPRESTLPITDNIYRKPRMLVLECSISDNSALLLIGGIVNDINRATGELPYSREVWEYLRRIADAPYALQVETALESYSNMFIKQLGDVVRDLRNARTLKFSLTLKECIIVTSDTTDKEPEEGNTSDKVSSTTNKGNKPKEELNPAQDSKNRAVGGWKQFSRGVSAVAGG